MIHTSLFTKTLQGVSNVILLCLGSHLAFAEDSQMVALSEELSQPAIRQGFVMSPMVLTEAEPVVVSAKRVTVKLQELHPIIVTESGNDELYVAVTSYPSYAKPTHYRVPRFPIAWHSSEASHVKSLELWQGEVPEEESVSLVFTLIEHDSFQDDLIGTARLLLKHQRGKITANWKIPNKGETKTKHQTIEDQLDHTIDYQEDEGHYRVDMRILVEDLEPSTSQA